MKRRGLLLVVSGPSGVGKGAVTAGLAQRHPDLRKSVSWTTRDPRPGERDGVDYVFVTEEHFRQHLQENGFLEWACVHESWMYGTPREPVQEALRDGADIIVEIDCQGARSVRSALPHDAVLVFIAPPSWQALVDRLEKRDTERPEQVTKRLQSARRELDMLDMFEYIIVNDDLTQATDELEAVLIGERQSASRVLWRELRESILQEADANH